MNRKQAKIRALKMVINLLTKSKALDLVDDDTTDEEAEKIQFELDVITQNIMNRVERLSTTVEPSELYGPGGYYDMGKL